MPSSKNYKRDYKQEQKTAKARGEVGGSDSDNAKRKRARRAMEKEGRVRKGEDVDHTKPLSKGGGNDSSNLRASPPGKNRSFPRNSDGSMKKGKK